jgi:hypothetical protein
MISGNPPICQDKSIILASANSPAIIANHWQIAIASFRMQYQMGRL